MSVRARTERWSTLRTTTKILLILKAVGRPSFTLLLKKKRKIFSSNNNDAKKKKKENNNPLGCVTGREGGIETGWVVCNFNNKFWIKCYIYFVFCARNLFSATTSRLSSSLNETQKLGHEVLFLSHDPLTHTLTIFIQLQISLSFSLSLSHTHTHFRIKYFSLLLLTIKNTNQQPSTPKREKDVEGSYKCSNGL